MLERKLKIPINVTEIQVICNIKKKKNVVQMDFF